MDILLSLCSKDKLDTSDVLCLLRCLQKESTPILTPKRKQTITPSRKKFFHSSESLSTNTYDTSPQINQRKCRESKNKDTKRNRRQEESSKLNERAAVKEKPVFLDLKNADEFPPMTVTPAPKQQ